MTASTPVWAMILPLVLLMLFAVLGLAGFGLQKLVRSQPELAGVAKFVALMFFGLLGFLLLGALLFTARHSQVVEQTATVVEPRMVHSPRETEILQRVDAELEAQGISRTSPFDGAPSYTLQQPQSVTQQAPIAVGRLAFVGLASVVLVSVCLGAFLLVRTLSSRQRLAGGAVLAAIFVGLLVVGLFVARVSTQQSTESATEIVIHEQMRASDVRLHAPPRPEPPIAPPMATPVPAKQLDGPVSALPVAQNALTPLPTDDRSTPEPEAFTPNWIRAGVQRKGEVTTVVCSSQQFASVEEADADARAAVRDYMLEERRRTVPHESFGPRTTPSVEGLVNAVVKDRYVETIQRDFGTFFAPMHRVWLKAEVTPLIYTQMRAAYTAELQESRMMVAGSALAALLCVPLGIVTCGRLDRWTNHRFPRILQAGIGAAVLGLWTLGAVVLQQFVTF